MSCLADAYPKLTPEWHPTRNSPHTPYTLPADYPYELVWKCSSSRRHVYKATIRDRVVRGFGCKKCTFQTELILEKWLKSMYPEVVAQATFPWGVGASRHPYRYDFYLPIQHTVLELDGEQHFRRVKRKWSPPSEVRRNDVTKTSLARVHGLSTIRILQNDVFYDRMDWKEALTIALEHTSTLATPDVVYLSTEQGKYWKHHEDYSNMSSTVIWRST